MPIYDPIEERNRRIRFLDNLKQALKSAWKTILYIDLLDKTDDFRNNRYASNRKTLYSIINEVNGFGECDNSNRLSGCCKYVTVDERFLWTEKDYFNNSSSKSDFKRYLNKFPNGKYALQAKTKLEEIKQRDEKIMTMISVAIILVVAIIFFVVYANYKGNSSSENNSDRIEQRSVDFPSISSPPIDAPGINDVINDYDEDSYENDDDSSDDYQENDDFDNDDEYSDDD